MKFQPSTKPVATIDNAKHGGSYYTLRMGEQEIGGTNKAALAAYARKQGYTVKVVRNVAVRDDCNGGPL